MACERMADPPRAHQPAPPMRSRATARAAYAVCALALLYAVPSFYWALGGTAGLHTVGGRSSAGSQWFPSCAHAMKAGAAIKREAT